MDFRAKHLKRIVALCVTILMVLNMAIVNVTAESGLNAKMYWTQNLSQTWSDAETTQAIFDTTELDVGGEALRYIKVENAGSLDFSYQIKFVSENATDALANAIDVYYLPDVSADTQVSAMTKIGTLSQVINGESISSGYISPEGTQRDGYTKKERIIAVALKMHQNADASLMGKKVDFDIKLTATDANKFYTKFKNTDKYLYRVGNANAVSLGSLFGAYADAQIGNVSVDVKPLDDSIAVSGTYTADSSNWTNGKINFSGTGPVVVTISDDKMAVPVALNLEVVNAENVTAKTDVKDKNIVLLNDISGGFTVSNGYAVYGNGFKVTCSGNGSYGSKGLAYGFVTLDNGTLDNVKLICDIFPKSYMYTSEMTADSSNRYPYAYSAIAATNGSKISNCYIYGARNNIFIGTGDVTVENTVTECGSLSNIQIKGTDANTVTLDNVTTIQYQTTSNYDTSSKVLGFGVVVGDNESVSNSKIKLKGDLKQYNWVTNADTSVSNTYAKEAISSALKETDYHHTINSTTTVNTGIAYLNDKTATIIDERDNKDAIPYVLKNITMSYGIVTATGQVYSVSKSSVTADSRYDAETDGVIPYIPSANGYISPTVVFGGVQNDSLSFGTTYNTAKGMWEYKLTVDLDTIDGGSYAFRFADLKPQKYGQNLEFTVKDSSGNTVDKNTAITLKELYSKEYTLVASDNLIFDENGEKEAKTVTAQIPFVLYATKTSIEPPKFIENTDAIGEAYRLVSSKGGEWRPAYPVLDGVSVSYWSASEKKTKLVDLAGIYNSGKISSNVWTYTCDDYTLTITGGAVHSDGTTITPVVSNNKLYFVSTNKAFGTNTTSRNIILTYVFTDKNASTTWNRTKTVTYSALAEYDYDSFKNGTLQEPSSGGGCFTPGTLITLADGSQKRIDELTFDDDILVWDFFNGEYTVSKPSLLIDDGVKDYDIINLSFDDESSLRIIYEHGLFDVDANDYVYINKDNVHEFVGHTFIKNNGLSNTEVKLTGYEITKENIGCYTILTAQYNNCIANGLLTVTPPPIDGFYDYFEIGEGMKYDSKLMAEDIEKYGLYTYEDFADYISYKEFVAFNGAYLKLPVEKGYFTFANILEQVKAFGVGVVGDDEEIEPIDDIIEDMGIVPLAEEMYLATDTVISANNTVCTATYTVVVTGDGYADGTITTDECTLTLSAGGTASNGYAKLTIDDESYYTVQIPNGSSIDVVFKNAEGRAVSVTPYWGNSADYGISQENLVASGDVFNMSFYISAVQNGTNGVDAVLVNNSKDDVTADVYVAVYESTGKMVDFARTNMTVTKAEKTGTYESNLAMPEGGYAKAFVWNTDTIVPMIEMLSTK